jgi:hypothetical protein
VGIWEREKPDGLESTLDRVCPKPIPTPCETG